MKLNPSIPVGRLGGDRRSGLLKLCAAACFCAALSAAGQAGTTNGVTTTAELVATLQSRLAEAQAERGLTWSAQSDAALPPGATKAEAEEYGILSEMLVRLYQEHLDQAARLDEVGRRQRDLDQKINAWSGFPEPAPYSLLLVDELRDSAQALVAQAAASAASLKVLAAVTADAEAALKESDAHLRQLAEQLETVKDAGRLTRLTWQRNLEQLRNRRLLASVALEETRRRLVEAERAQDQQQLAFVRRQLTVANERVRFSQADLERVLAGLDAERREVDRELAEAERDIAGLERDLTAAREELRSALLNPAQERAAGPDGGGGVVARLQALVELRGVQVETGSQKLAVLRRLAEVIVGERGLWQVRYATFHTARLDELREGYRRLEKMERMLYSVRPYFRQQVELAASRIAEQRNRMRNLPAVQGVPDAAQELLDCCRQQEELANRALRSLERLGRLTSCWKASLDEDRQRLPLTARLRDLFGGFSSVAAKFWNFELFVALDTITVDGQTVTGRRSVTVGKVVMAVLILAVGYWLSLLASALLERVAVKRLKVDPGRASLIRRGVRAVLLVGLVIFSLVSVKIPLTIFAFLGGALAIGLGFGTQTLLKNFVSGVIILFNRPFRLGDVLEVGGSRGVVNSIGIHSCVIRLFDGTETLIPNSALLENNLTNCTYTDRKVRFAVTVGVAYGSDTRRVSQLLAEEAERHGLVQKEPAPQVLFKDFGDSALVFELRYWVDVVKHDAAQIGSDLRHMIAGVFAQNGIVLAFPQRDIHLDTARPLQVRIEGPAAPVQPEPA